MEINHVAALRRAYDYNMLVREHKRFNKVVAVEELAATALFTPVEIAVILGTSVPFAKKHYGWHTNGSWPQRKWNPLAVDLMYNIALAYSEGRVSRRLIQLAIGAGCSIKAIAELTGIDITEVREAAYA